MGLLDGIRKRGTVIPNNATFRLTENGRDKLQEFNGDPKSRILVALETRGTSDIEEICNASKLSKGQVERFVPILVRGGYIQYVSASQQQSDI